MFLQSLHIKQSQYEIKNLLLGADDGTNECIVNFKQQLKVLAREKCLYMTVHK